MHKNEILPFAPTWMDLEGMMLKWNKLDRKRQILRDVTYMWIWKIQQTSEYHKKEADSQV